MSTSKEPKFKIDFSADKFASHSRNQDQLIHYLFYSYELPKDLHTQLSMSCESYQATVYRLLNHGLIEKICRDRITGYCLTAKGKRLTDYRKYEKYYDRLGRKSYTRRDPYIRLERHQFAYLYALLDRAGIPYESYAKKVVSKFTLSAEMVYFYTAFDLNRTLGMNTTCFIGSKLLGFFVGRGKVIPVYRTNHLLTRFSEHEALVPEDLERYFGVTSATAILICNDEEAVMNITRQIVESKRKLHLANYRHFYVLPSDDSFLERFNEIYADHTAEEKEIIESRGIDTKDTDSSGRYRLVIGTGFLNDHSVLLFTGNVDVAALKRFINNITLTDDQGYIICRSRDLDAVKTFVKGKDIEVSAI